MARGLEKNLYPIMSQYSPVRFAGRFVVFLSTVLGPMVGLLHPSWVAWLSLSAIAWVVGFAFVMRRIMALRIRGTLLLPLGQLIIAVMALNSARACLSRGAIEWRGTRYSLRELKTLQRVKV